VWGLFVPIKTKYYEASWIWKAFEHRENRTIMSGPEAWRSGTCTMRAPKKTPYDSFLYVKPMGYILMTNMSSAQEIMHRRGKKKPLARMRGPR
jgi:hypothetical protein